MVPHKSQLPARRNMEQSMKTVTDVLSGKCYRSARLQRGSAPASGRSKRVLGASPTPTGLTVNRGERLSFTTIWE